jgi:hypothetical protein
MTSRFEPHAGLDAVVAQRWAYPAVDRALERMHDLARAGAPPVRVWITARDDRVRDTHVETDGQAIPDNLRFKLPSTHGFGHDLARYPRDPELPTAQSINCRCDDPTLPDLLRRSIHRTVPMLQGNRVTGEVYTHFPRAAESEFGSHGDPPARYMTRALQQTAASMTSTRAR